MISLNSQAGTAAPINTSPGNSAASSTGSRVFENDKYAFSTHGTEDVSLHNKHTGETHEASGNFGQDLLDGCRHDHQGASNSPIDKIVKKVIEAVCKALGIDPKEILGDQHQGEQPPTGGCGPDNPSVPTNPWSTPHWRNADLPYQICDGSNSASQTQAGAATPQNGSSAGLFPGRSRR